MSQTELNAIYEAGADHMTVRFDARSTEAMLGWALDLLPRPPAAALDIGAGSGRDSGWLARRGYEVTAVEPVAAFHPAIRRNAPEAGIVSATLPALDGVDGPQALIIVNAVLHHLDESTRDAAFARLHELLGAGGVVLVSLRIGAAISGKPVHALDPAAEIARAARAGLVLARRDDQPAADDAEKRAGLSWTWLALNSEAPK